MALTDTSFDSFLIDAAVVDASNTGTDHRRSPRPGTLLEFRPDPAALLAEVRRSRIARPMVSVRDRPATHHAFGQVLTRCLLLAAAMVIVALGWSVAGWLAGPGNGVAAVGAESTEAAQTIVVVQPGDTLWTIAARVAPADDVRATVDRLAERNGGTALTVGQRLVIAD